MLTVVIFFIIALVGCAFAFYKWVKASEDDDFPDKMA